MFSEKHLGESLEEISLSQMVHPGSPGLVQNSNRVLGWNFDCKSSTGTSTRLLGPESRCLIRFGIQSPNFEVRNPKFEIQSLH